MKVNKSALCESEISLFFLSFLHSIQVYIQWKAKISICQHTRSFYFEEKFTERSVCFYLSFIYKYKVFKMGDLSRSKSILICTVVLGCFAVLWPKIFYPMFFGPNPDPIAEGKKKYFNFDVPLIVIIMLLFEESRFSRPDKPIHMMNPDMVPPPMRDTAKRMGAAGGNGRMEEPRRTIDRELRVSEKKIKSIGQNIKTNFIRFNSC